MQLLIDLVNVNLLYVCVEGDVEGEIKIIELATRFVNLLLHKN